MKTFQACLNHLDLPIEQPTVDSVYIIEKVNRHIRKIICEEFYTTSDHIKSTPEN